MEKRTKTRRYDTETAKEVFKSDESALYRKMNGEFFLFSGSEITPVSYDEAKAWAEEHMPPDEVDAVFGKISLGGKKTTYTFRLSAGIAEILKREAARSGESLSEIVERAVWMYSGE